MAFIRGWRLLEARRLLEEIRYVHFLSNLLHFLLLLKYFMIWLHYFWIFHHFCSEVCTHSTYSIKIYTEPSALLLWKVYRQSRPFWADKTSDFHTKYYGWYSVWCCSCYYYYTISLSKAWTLVLQRFKPCSRRVGDCQWLESQTMVSAGNKTTRLSSVNHTTRVIHH